jgi:hypothetical protein
MDPSVGVTTPNWDRFLECGPLTDADIERYQLAGYYGLQLQHDAQVRAQQREAAKHAREAREHQREADAKRLDNYLQTLLKKYA